MAVSRGRLQAAAVALLVYVMAFLHGATRREPAACPACPSSPAEYAALRDAIRAIQLTPHSEHVMAQCLLAQPDARAALRERMHSCLVELGAETTRSPPPPTPQSLAGVETLASASVHAQPLMPSPRSRQLSAEDETLQQQLATSREVHRCLPAG
eukprot:6210180-Pleurochrysis_carterae.AAC.1